MKYKLYVFISYEEFFGIKGFKSTAISTNHKVNAQVND